jgi:hypothetical protein
MMNYAEMIHTTTVPSRLIASALRAVRDVAGGASDLRAVRHPLGFACFPIARRAGGGICVHVWRPGIQPARLTTSEIHAHSWDLLSHVLSGELHNMHLTVLDDEPTYRVFEVHSGDSGDELRATARLVSCRTAERDVYRRGDTYSLEAGSFHATVASAAITVVVGVARAGLVDLSLGAIDGCSHVVHREQYDRAASARIARVVAEQVSEVGIAASK